MDGGQPACWNRKRDAAWESQEAGSYFDAVLEGESCGTNWYAPKQAYWMHHTHMATLPNMAGTCDSTHSRRNPP